MNLQRVYDHIDDFLTTIDTGHTISSEGYERSTGV